MKKLLLIISFPCVLVASEQKDERSSAQKAATAAVETAHYANAAYRGYRLAVATATGDWVTIGTEVLVAGKSLLTTSTLTVSAVQVINPKSTLTPLEQAQKESAARISIAEEMSNSALRLCLSQNANCTDVTPRGIPKRCVSPARDYAMLNKKATDQVVDNFLQWQKERRGSI